MKINQTKLQAWRSLSPEDRGSLVRAWACLFIARAALPVLPLPRVESLLERLPGGSRGVALPAARLARLIDIAARHHLLPMTCLPRSLALKALLRRQGDEASLRIGVRREAGGLRAHAWIERAGEPVGERAATTRVFAPLMLAEGCS
jgi:hypothetical protein